MGAAPQGPVGGLKPPDRSRRLRRIVVVLGAALLLGVAAVGLTLLRARTDLAAGRDALLDGRRALVAGNLDEATEAFARAEIRFQQAADHADGGLGRLAGWVPMLGNDVEVAAALAHAGVHLAGAGSDVGRALAAMPDGIGSLAPSGGRLPLERYAALGDAVGSARAEADAAVATIEDSPSSFLVGPVLEARWEAEDQARQLARSLTAGELLARGLPGFAGADGARRYLVVAESPAELRGTGGLWGAYTILTFRRGRPTFGHVAPTGTLRSFAPEAVPAPNPDYARNYDQFGGAGSWQNLNMTPDFPSAAQAALANYRKGEHRALAGVIAADPFALRSMLGVTGPVTIPGLEVRIDEDNVIAFTENEAYGLFDGPTERKEVLGAAATDVLGRFLSMEGKGLARAHALAEAIGGGHLKLFSVDPDFEHGLDLAGAAGAFAPVDGGDVVAVTVNNGSANKVDYWAVRHVAYAVTLGGDGEAIATLDTTIRNDAPRTGQPRYVLGPNAPGLHAGDQLPLLTVSCHEPCTLASATRDGEPVAVTPGSELGIDWYRDYRTIPAGDTGALSLTWHTEHVWEGNSSGGDYRLTFLGQTTIEPTDLSVSITAPAGTRIVWTNVPMALDGGTATWEGTTSPRTVLEVRFRAPLPLRWWRNVVRPLGG